MFDTKIAIVLREDLADSLARMVVRRLGTFENRPPSK